MSWSNATHVRLLNASIASEGNFACEISTQNLSTIRYEREIKVYGKCETFLPSSLDQIWLLILVAKISCHFTFGGDS